MPYYGTLTEEDRSLEKYLQEIARTPLLTRDQEQELGRLILRGDRSARDKLVHGEPPVRRERGEDVRAPDGRPDHGRHQPGQPRPHRGREALRLGQGTEVHHVRRVVDQAPDPQGHGGAVRRHAAPAEQGRSGQADVEDHRAPEAGDRPRAVRRGDRPRHAAQGGRRRRAQGPLRRESLARRASLGGRGHGACRPRARRDARPGADEAPLRVARAGHRIRPRRRSPTGRA